MSLSSADVSRKVLAENITLLWLLNKEPGEPAENSLSEHLRQETVSPSRHLTVERERDLVDNLAFLSASSDDPLKVTAVCVEEHQGMEGLTVRMASNVGDIQPVKEGFLRLAAILERAAAKDMSDKSSNALIREMIALNRGRIFSRLRSKHAKRSRRNYGKPPVIDRLAEAVSSVSASNVRRLIQRTDLEQVRAQVEELQRLFKQLEAMTEEQAVSQEVYTVLIDLLRCAHSLASQNNLTELFSNIPNSGRFEPNERSSLPIAVGKLGRYYSTCSFLIVAARRLSIFKSVRVEIVKLPSPAAASLITQSEPPLSATLDRVLKPGTKNRKERARLFDSLEGKLTRQLAAAPKRYKIHAEIQLLFYYEMHPEIRRPRVICSSKSACFLCDLFIKIHAQYYVARTHGVLYDKWILPDWETVSLQEDQSKEMARVVERFNAALEDRIRLTLSMPRIRRFHPNESVLVDIASWTPSANSVATSTNPQTGPAAPKSGIDVKDHSHPVTHAEFRSSTVTQTFADESGLEKGWNPTDPTSSEPILETGACSVDLTPTSSISLPEIVLPPPSELSGRQNGVIDGGIRQASPASEDLFEKPACASLRSLRSVRSNEAISEHSIGDIAQLDVSNMKDQKYRSFVHELSTSSPITCPSPIGPSYQPLIRGIWTIKELPTGGSPVKLSTRFIHMTLSYEWAEKTYGAATPEYFQEEQASLSSGECYQIKVKWLGPDEGPKRSSDQMNTNIVDLDAMDESVEETLSHGAASSSTELYISRRIDLVVIKFTGKEQNVTNNES
ncbi:MAG: hypothetical protein Q9217_004081 [Psora testacea]